MYYVIILTFPIATHTSHEMFQVPSADNDLFYLRT